jgi:hypothetical protein
LNTACGTTKVAAKKLNTFWKIPSERTWSHDRKSGRLFISVTANVRDLTGRDGALAPSAPRSAAQRGE